MYLLTSDAVQLYYELHGTGPPLVLIHGGLVDSRSWSGLIPTLGSRHKLVLYDVRGYGRSDKPEQRDAYSIARSVEDLAELVRHLSLPPTHILGFSQGGLVGLGLAASKPDLIRSLILVSTTACFTDQQRRRFHDRACAVEKNGLRDEQLTHVSLAFSKGFARQFPKLISEYAEALASNAPHSFAATLRVLAVADLRREASLVRCPTLILAGELDEAIPPDEHAEVLHHLIPGSVLHVLKGVGHTVHIEDPQGFSAVLLEFLAKVEEGEQGQGQQDGLKDHYPD